MIKKKNRDRVQMWVHPDFKETVGIDSAIKNVDMITITKEMANKEKIEIKKKRGFQFGF